MLPRGRGLCCMFVISNSLFFPFSCKDLNKLDSAHPPRAPCGARPGATPKKSRRELVSIHAPRAGRDLALDSAWQGSDIVSIHAPRAGRDLVG